MSEELRYCRSMSDLTRWLYAQDVKGFTVVEIDLLMQCAYERGRADGVSELSEMLTKQFNKAASARESAS